MASAPRQRDAAMLSNGTKLLLIGAVMAVVGLALSVPLDGTASGIGVAIAALGSVPLAAGLGLLVAGLVSRRARSGKPFA